MLTINMIQPDLPVTGVEGNLSDNLAIAFTDEVSGGGAVGIDPNDSAFDGIVQTAFDPLATVVFNTSGPVPSFSGGAAGIGTVVTRNVTGNPADDYEIAVFVFADFNLNDLGPGAEITAVGNRPFAILSRADITIAGTIDVSARFDGDAGQLGNQRLAGPGGGDGGAVLGGDGFAAPGAPATPNAYGINPDNVGQGGGGGGAFGGDGGGGYLAPNSVPALAGNAYGDLTLGIQGGSGGGAANTNVAIAAKGGGGGGGIELGAADAVTISGEILANGGRGLGFASFVGAGGGGAGGGILLHGDSVSLTSSAVLSAAGGDSVEASNLSTIAFGGGGAGGRIALPADAVVQPGAQLIVDGGDGNNLFDASDGVEGDINFFSAGLDPVEYEYTINWGDGQSSVGTFMATPGPGGLVNGVIDDGIGLPGIRHKYEFGGLYDVEIILTGGSNDPEEAVILTSAVIAGAGWHTGALVVVGTNGSDQVSVSNYSATHWKVAYDFGEGMRLVPKAAVSSGIEMYLRDGNDCAQVATNVAANAIMFGGDGNDLLVGGKGSDALFGGNGLDILIGNNGLDFLLGGNGIDLLYGEDDGDVIVGGRTRLTDGGKMLLEFREEDVNDGLSHHRDVNLLAIEFIMNGADDVVGWTEDGEFDYAQRSNSVIAQLADIVVDDEDIDVLAGGGGRDLFYRGDLAFLKDVLVDRTSSEVIVQEPEA